MKKNSRRDFIKKSLAGVAGAALIPQTLKAVSMGAEAKTAALALPVRKLGRTGLDIPLLSMGTSMATSTGLIRMGFDSGIRYFFSATYYGRGNNERLVGEALKDLPRSSYVVGTAATPEGFNPREGLPPKGLTAAGYMKTAEESLKRFGMDYIDVLLLPFADKKELVQNETILKAMSELKKQGKVRFLGIATHAPGDSLRAAADAKVFDLAMPAYNFKTKDLDEVNAAIAYAARAGMGIVAMKTSAGGREKSGAAPVNTVAALKWVLQNENVASIVSGMSSIDEVQANLAMLADLKLTEQERKDLGLAARRTQESLYCQQCRACLAQCPHGLDIPTLMRSYMYAYGYRDASQARYALDSSGIVGKPCETCASCSVACRSGFDVRERIRDISRLHDVPLEFIIQA